MKDLPELVAKHIFSKSLPLKKRSAVTVETWDSNEEMARAVELEAKLLGHNVITVYNDTQAFLEYARSMPRNRKLSLGKHETALLKNTDGYVFIPSPEMVYASTSLERSQLSAATSYNMEWYRVASQARLKGIRIGAGYFNSDRAASVLGKSRKEIMDHLLTASLADPAVLRRRGTAVSRRIRARGSLRIGSGGSELTVGAGREEELDDGRTDDDDVRKKINMSSLPGGFYSTDLKATAKGTLQCSSLFFEGRRAQGLEIEFSDGKVVSYSHDEWDDGLRKKFDEYVGKGKGVPLKYIGFGLNHLLRPGYGRDLNTAGAVSVWIGESLYALLEKPTVSSGGGEIVADGKLVLK